MDVLPILSSITHDDPSMISCSYTENAPFAFSDHLIYDGISQEKEKYFGMSFGLLNLTFVFIGLAGLALPVLAHLLSKRNFDVVEWGAMQFLELRKSTKRKLRLEQLLLMLLRMTLIALAALAFARPWAQGGFLTSIITGPPPGCDDRSRWFPQHGLGKKNQHPTFSRPAMGPPFSRRVESGRYGVA